MGQLKGGLLLGSESSVEEMQFHTKCCRLQGRTDAGATSLSRVMRCAVARFAQLEPLNTAESRSSSTEREMGSGDGSTGQHQQQAKFRGTTTARWREAGSGKVEGHWPLPHGSSPF